MILPKANAMILPTVYSPLQMLIQSVGDKTVIAYAKTEMWNE